MIAIKSYIKTHLITSGRKSTQMTLTERGPVVHSFEKERSRYLPILAFLHFSVLSSVTPLFLHWVL